MLLSVIVPVYNAERYLSRCLDSLLNQGVGEDEMEIFCVDDGSTDGSHDVLKQYAEAHPCIHVLSQKNAGAGAARNLGLDHARGEVVTFCDADDYLIPRGLGYIIDSFWDETVDVICHGSITLDAHRMKSWREDNEVSGMIVGQGSGSEVYRRDPKYFVWNTIIRRSFVENARLRFLSYPITEDACFLLELMMANPRTLDVSSNIYRYTVSEGQITRQRDPQMMRECIDAYLYFLSRLQHYELSEVMRVQANPFLSRVLSANLDRTEYIDLEPRVSAVGIRMVPYCCYKPMSFLFRHLFVPYILPKLRRG